MVKYTCKTPTARVNETTAVREALPKRMPGVLAQGNRVDNGESPRPVRWGSTPRLTVIAGSNPAVRCKTYRQWIGLSFGTQKNGTRNRVRERFILTFAIIRQRAKCLGISCGAMQKRPCL